MSYESHFKKLIHLIALAIFIPISAPAMGQNEGRKSSSSRKIKLPLRTLLHNQLVSIKQSYRMGEITASAAWEKLDNLTGKGGNLIQADRVGLLQSQAALLKEAGFPILAAIYSSQAIKTAERPLSKDLVPSWEILNDVSEKKPIQTILEIVADQVDLRGKNPPSFKSNWHYIAANAASKKGDLDIAAEYLGKLKVQDKYFLPAKYQQAMIYVDQNKLENAEVALKSVLFAASQSNPAISANALANLIDYTHLALGRINYERGKFEDSIRSYRNVNKNGPNFYDALFEQSWSFFMGGFPMHALGALHGAESPFFAQVFNPEATMLRSMIHYWLCRYDDSRNALADFMEKNAAAIEELNEFLDRQRADSEVAYQLFENMISGVSGRSLGLPQAILKTNAERDSMLFLRDQYAAVIEENSRLDAKGIFGSKERVARASEYLDRWISSLRREIGKRFMAELVETKKDYERLYTQAQFLYVELLMSEKDQILGKNLHASTKITKVSQQYKVNGWADKTQSWKDSRNGEYWWDEVGFYITPVGSNCQMQTSKK